MSDFREYLHEFKREVITIDVILLAGSTTVQISGNHNIGRTPVGYAQCGSTVAGVSVGQTDDELAKCTKDTWVGHADGTAKVKVEVW